MNKGYPLNLRRYRLVRKKDNKYHPAYSHNHVEKEAQLFAGRSKVLSRIAATSIHTENHITNVTNKESKLCNIHGTILLYFTSRIRLPLESRSIKNFEPGPINGLDKLYS